MILTPWSNTTAAHSALCNCPDCIAADLALLCGTPDPLARIAASLNRPEQKRAIA